MGKKYLALGLLVGAACIMTYFGYKAFSIQREKDKIAIAIKKIPTDFIFSTLYHKLFTYDSLPKGKSIVFVLFSSSCDHCQNQVNEIYQNKKLFQNVALYFVTNESSEMAKEFVSSFKIDSLDFATALIDSSGSFFRSFGIHSTPAVFIYSAQGRLLQQFNGEVRSAVITKYSSANEVEL